MNLFEVVKNIYRTPYLKNSRYGLTRLDMNENTKGMSQEFIRKVLADVDTDTLIGYPEVFSLYKKLSNFLNVNEEEVMLTNGSDSGIRSIFEIFTKPGDHIAFFSPSFVMYEIYSKIFSLNIIEMEYDSNLELDYSNLFLNIDKIKLVILTNPNSPLGTPLKNDDLEKVFDITLKKNIPVLLDEAYCEFNTGFNYTKYYQKYPNVITTRTFSKAFGLAGVRLGYLLADKSIIQSIKNAEPSFDINAFAIMFANAILDNVQIVQSYINQVKETKTYFQDEMKKLKIETISSASNSIMFKVDNPELRKKIFKDLENRKILIKESITPPFQNYMRVSFGTKEQIENVVKVIKEYY